MDAPRKLKVATASLAGCFGCHMSLLDIDERLFTLLDLVEKKLVEPKEAYMKSVDKGAFVAALKAKGHDTSFVEPDASAGGAGGAAGAAAAKQGMAAKR